jgi:hypothetical protein
MDRHISILGMLFVIYHALGLLAGLGLFALLSGIGLFTGDLQAAGILTIIGTALGLFLVVVSLPGFVAGIGLLQRKSWSRIIALIVGFLNLFNVPIGTALGVYTIWALMNPDAERLLSGARAF